MRDPAPLNVVALVLCLVAAVLCFNDGHTAAGAFEVACAACNLPFALFGVRR